MKKGKMKSVQHKQDERIHLEQSVTGKMYIVKKLNRKSIQYNKKYIRERVQHDESET